MFDTESVEAVEEASLETEASEEASESPEASEELSLPSEEVTTE